MIPATTQLKSLSPAKISFQQIVALAKTQGYLTYQQADSYLPDECADSVHVDRLLDLVDALGIDFIEAPGVSRRQAEEISLGDRDLFNEELPKLTDDPIRMYLSQMCRIPLLNREE
jgi:RNA polymerase primary sigma factor